MELNLGKAINAERSRQHLTQAELARRVGCVQSNVSHWESGAAIVPTRRLPAIADALGVTVEDLIRLSRGAA